MKRVKRLFACLLALTMILGLSATAFAQSSAKDKSQKPENGGEVKFTKEYKLNGAGESPAETFNFTITAAGVKDGGTGSDNQGVPTVKSGASFSKGAATVAGAQADATVQLPNYTAVGTYSYTISENAGTTAGVTYATSTATMKVTVINGDTDGTYKISGVTFWKGDNKLDTGNAGGEDNDAAFTNTYTANKLNITKIVAGALGDKNKEFEFTVTLTAPIDKKFDSVVTLKKSDGTSETVSFNGKSIGNGTETVFGTATFKLKHGATASIENLPSGVEYRVEETKVTGYTTDKENASGTMVDTEKTAKFTNTKNGGTDTGVYLDNLPYLLVFAGVLAIAAVFVVRRRRFED